MNFWTKSLSIVAMTTVACSNHISNKEPNKDQGQIYVLGDSLSDNGNLANILNHYNPISWLHKIKMPKPFFDNRWTTGEVAAEVFADHFGIKLTPGWYAKGNNYAVDSALASQMNTFKWTDPIGYYYKYLLDHYAINHQAEQLIKDHQINPNDKIFIEIGANDLMNEMFYTQTELQQELIVSDAVATEAYTVNFLINHGAKQIVVANNPDLAKTPLFNVDNQQLAKQVHKLVNMYNDQLKHELDLISNNADKGVKLLQYNLYNQFNKALGQAKDIGIDTHNKAVISSINQVFISIFTGRDLKYADGVNDDNINHFAFFDFLHPNKWLHKNIGDDLYYFVQGNC